MPEQLLIGGRWIDGSDGNRIVVIDPATGDEQPNPGPPSVGPGRPLRRHEAVGREGSTEGIYEFCETQYIAASW